MKKSLLLLTLLAACTSNHYEPMAGNDFSKEKQGLDNHECAYSEIEKLHAARNNNGAILGAVILGPFGGILGGIAGGAAAGGLGGAIGGSTDNPPKLDLNVEIQKCMESKGYVGHSSGYN